MVQCVPELLVYTPVESETKATGTKHRPRMKFTPKRKSPEKAERKKTSNRSPSTTAQRQNVASESVSRKKGRVEKFN